MNRVLFFKILLDAELKEEITALGLKYNLLTEFTPFVAIDPIINSIRAQNRNPQSPPPPPTSSDILSIVDCDVELCEELHIEDSEGDFEIVYMEVEEEEEGDGLLLIVEEMPEYPGGAEALTEFIANILVYPPIAVENGVSGIVYISFAIDVDGSITDIKIVRGVSSELEAEATRIIKAMPKWKPGKQRGKPVKVSYTIPVRFSLT
ncbi:energy transducer TonB [Carboxylicivirga sp. M1479]|uniref:energy transducer TonB n=1 Tax=Carboxylicivirga sp. M1479 TaxID=2594476 RepID=UPI0011778E81|nr:energy transducer TonB [Carboxylicivirga sp. M1479]TRX71207.1 energy transducer TonB [Carboxylicivirga sp. M1479]